jgi:hypothetical protein
MSYLIALLFLAGLATEARPASARPYSRASDLAAVEMEIRRWQNSLPSAEMEAVRTRLQSEADMRYLFYTHVGARSSHDFNDLIEASTQLHAKWMNDSHVGYVSVMPSASAYLLDCFPENLNAKNLAVICASNSLARLSSVPLLTAGIGLTVLTKPANRFPREFNSALVDLLPRADALAGILGVLNRVEMFMRQQGGSPTPGETTLVGNGSAVDRGIEVTRTLGTVEEFAASREAREKRETQAYFASIGEARPADPHSGHQKKLESNLLLFLKRRYDLTATNVAEVRAAFDRHVTVPALRERLLLAAYGSTNYSAAATSIIDPVNEGHLNAVTTTVGPAIQTDPATKSSKQAATHTVSERRSADPDLTPLAAASGVGVGHAALWLAFAGAAALIVLVLWRAQARRASGGQK